MAEYHVVWRVEIDADSPEEAAREARAMQMDPDNEAACFEVFKGFACDARGNHEEVAFIDLMQLDGDTADGGEP